MKISVVVPLYNKEGLIFSCIESLSRQTVLPSVLVLVDDGSTDSSYDMAMAALRDYPGAYKVHRQRNSGVSVARNKGASISGADYICFLDADDVWDSSFLECISCLIEECPEADLFCLGHRVYDPAVGFFIPAHGCSEGYRGYVSDFFKASIIGSVANSSKVAVRADKFFKVGGFPEGETVGEDLYLWMMLALKGRVACDSSIMVTVNQIDDSSREARLGNVPYPLRYFSKLRESSYLPKSAKRYLKKMYILHFAGCIRVGDYKGAFRLIRTSFFLIPICVVFSIPLLMVPRGVVSMLRNIRRRGRLMRSR
ncbi:glycosyltransferase family 2 protein [Pseudomonas sp. D2-3]